MPRPSPRRAGSRMPIPSRADRLTVSMGARRTIPTNVSCWSAMTQCGPGPNRRASSSAASCSAMGSSKWRSSPKPRAISGLRPRDARRAMSWSRSSRSRTRLPTSSGTCSTSMPIKLRAIPARGALLTVSSSGTRRVRALSRDAVLCRPAVPDDAVAAASGVGSGPVVRSATARRTHESSTVVPCEAHKIGSIPYYAQQCAHPPPSWDMRELQTPRSEATALRGLERISRNLGTSF